MKAVLINIILCHKINIKSHNLPLKLITWQISSLVLYSDWLTVCFKTKKSVTLPPIYLIPNLHIAQNLIINYVFFPWTYLLANNCSSSSKYWIYPEKNSTRYVIVSIISTQRWLTRGICAYPDLIKSLRELIYIILT